MKGEGGMKNGLGDYSEMIKGQIIGGIIGTIIGLAIIISVAVLWKLLLQ